MLRFWYRLAIAGSCITRAAKQVMVMLYGHQEGAVVSYNPQKPGRPSHIIHTYWIGNLRLVLDAQLQAGNRHSPSHGRSGLRALLQSLPAPERPKLVRGDSAYGSEGEMLELEELQQPYLFKLRQTAGVKQLIKRQWARQDSKGSNRAGLCG